MVRFFLIISLISWLAYIAVILESEKGTVNKNKTASYINVQSS